MNNNIKSEFKDFIKVLSTDICKEVLLEDIKSINKSLDETSKAYKKIQNEYINNITGIKEQFNQLDNTNKKLNDFITNITNNSNKVNKALNIVEGGNKTAIENMMNTNQKLFDTYHNKIQSLNETERSRFITALVSAMDEKQKKYLLDIGNIVNGSKIEGIKKELSLGIEKAKQLEAILNESRVEILKSDAKVINEFDKKLDTAENQITNKINQLNSTINDISIDLNGKIAALNTKINNKNNIIIVLTTIIILVSIFIK